MSILVVDEDRSFLEETARVLVAESWQVETTCDGKSALEVFAQHRELEVVLVALRMTQMDGLAVTSAIRERDLDIPVILVTAAPDVSSAAKAFELGVFRYLTKPLDKGLLIDAVTKASQTCRLARLKHDARPFVVSLPYLAIEQINLEARFGSALASLRLLYQPVVQPYSWALVGYEAFVSHDEPTLAHPAHLLDAAHALGRTNEVGRTVRRLVAEAVSATPKDLLFSVNLHASDLVDFDLFSPQAPLSDVAHRIILDITERQSLADVDNLPSRIQKLRSLGYRIAVDELGRGHAGLSSLGLLAPDLVKLSASLTHNIHRSAQQQSIVRAMVRLCSRELSMGVVCEGVDTEQERDVLVEFGFDCMQGELFGRPEPLPPSLPVGT